MPKKLPLAIRFIAGLIALPAAIIVASAFANEPDARPWAEKVIIEHVDQASLKGRLDGGELEALRQAGEHLFTGKFTTRDGAGRPMATQAIIPTKRSHGARSAFQRLPGPDATSCASCHNEPMAGGAGDVTANVFVSEGFTNADFDTSDPQFSNERNTNHLMGAGLVELLAREMTADLTAQRNEALRKAAVSGEPVRMLLLTKGVGFGSITAMPDGMVDFTELEGVDSDLNIRPFSQKGVFTSLRQFTVNAMNHHHGMQAIERFGPRWTGENDFDEDGHSDELLDGDISALVAWQATLEAPKQIVPENELWRSMASTGERIFEDIGCASCHIPALPLEDTVFSDPGPLDAAGTLREGEVADRIEYELAELDWVKTLPRNEAGHLMVPLFSDLKRHRISDQQIAAFGNELLAQRFVERDQFQTSELWGIGSTAPYGHRGNMTTLDEAIRAHGGEAAEMSRAYKALQKTDRDALVAYLKTLVIKP